MMYGYGSSSKWARDRHREELLDFERVSSRHISFLFNLSGPRCKRSSWMSSSNKQCVDNPNCFVNLGAEKRKQSDHSLVKQRLGDDPSSRLRPEGVPVVGLKNLGATCYMNALLQTLYHNRTFRHAIFSWEPSPDQFDDLDGGEDPIAAGAVVDDMALVSKRASNGLDPTRKGVSKSESMPNLSSSAELLGGEGDVHPHTARRGASSTKDDPSSNRTLSSSVCYQLQLLFAHMQDGQEKHLDPTALVEALGLNPCIQQDSQEFYKLIITFLEKKFNSCAPSSMLRTLIADMFMGRYFYVTTCVECSRVTRQPGVFYEIELRIGSHKDIRDCLEAYFDEEEIEDFSCEDCCVPVTVKRSICLSSCPPVLYLQLMRFVYDVKKGRKKKVTSTVKFHRELDMKPYMQGGASTTTATATSDHDDKALYSLMCIVCHIGPSAHGGHYICYTRCNGDWFRIDDSTVVRCKDYPFGTSRVHTLSMGLYGQSDRRIDKNETPYLLVYHQKGYDFIESPKVGARALRHVVARTERFLTSMGDYGRLKNFEMDSIKAMKSQFDEVFSNISVSSLDSTSYFWIDVGWLKKWLEGREDVGPIDNSGLLCADHGKVCHECIPRMKRISPTAWNYLVGAFGGGPELTHEDCCVDCAQGWLDANRKRRELAKEKRRIASLVSSESYSSSGYWISRAWYARWEASKASELATLMPNCTFDIVCPHGGLVVARNVRRVVPRSAWEYFREAYPCEDTITFEYPHASPCATCVAHHEELAKVARARERARLLEKQDLRSVYRLAGRYHYRDYCRTGERYFIISTEWLHAWKAYIDDCSIESVRPIDNASLVCEHGQMAYDVTATMAKLGSSDKGVMERLSPSEWKKLHHRHSGGPVIEWTVVRHVGSEWKGRSVPDVCTSCAERRAEQDRLAALDFKSASVYVVRGGSSSSSTTSSSSSYLPRRELTISSTDTIMDLKIKVFDKLDIPPFQQKLYSSDRTLLVEDEKTVRDYEIAPRSVLMVHRVAHLESYDVIPSDGSTATTPEEAARASHLPKETGFEGTKLTIGSPIMMQHHLHMSDDDEFHHSAPKGEDRDHQDDDDDDDDASSTTTIDPGGDGGGHSDEFVLIHHDDDGGGGGGGDDDDDAVDVDGDHGHGDQDEWPCSVCTFLNPASSRASMVCTMCGTDNSPSSQIHKGAD